MTQHQKRSPNHTSYLTRSKKLVFLHPPTNMALAPENKVRQVGLIYAVYRILIGVLLILTNLNANTIIRLSNLPQNLFPYDIEYLVLGWYVAMGTLLLVVLYSYRHLIRQQLLFGLGVDMLALTALMYSGSAKDLQMALLLMVVCAVAFMLVKVRHAIILTLLALISLLAQQLYHGYTGTVVFLKLSDTLMISISLVAVGFLSWSVSQRLSIAEFVAQKNAQEIKQLNAINTEVIKNMVNGVLVIGRMGRLLLINDTARLLLRLDNHQLNDPFAHQKDSSTAHLFDLEQQLAKHYPLMVAWYQNDSARHFFLLNLPQHVDYPTGALRLHKKLMPEYGKLLIVEDISREESHAQQLKLASLGQLSASIAHEIRNPLGAISQAAEFLLTFANDANDSGELYQIIYNNTKRIDRIIEDVMRLSRQEAPRQQAVNLTEWLPRFVQQHYPEANIAIDFSDAAAEKTAGKNTLIIFDPSHLEQIVINLVSNALRHTKALPAAPDVQLLVHTPAADTETVILDILDNGDGVKTEDLPSLFNPFFTKSVGGTGLGLYLSKAFSEANHAHLLYLSPQQAGKTCFRLLLPTARYFLD